MAVSQSAREQIEDWDPSGPIFYVDTSEVLESGGKLRVVIKELIDFIDANVPRIMAYNIYLNNDDSRMTVVQVHPDSTSLEHHMEVAGPIFSKFVDLVSLLSIDVYGEPSEKLLEQLDHKAQLLGRGTVTVHGLEAGLTRFRSAGR